MPYTGGNGGAYSAITINSTGITGLTATASAGNLAIGSGNIVFTITGTPAGHSEGNAVALFALTLGGQSCSFRAEVIETNVAGALYFRNQTLNGTFNGVFVSYYTSNGNMSTTRVFPDTVVCSPLPFATYNGTPSGGTDKTFNAVHPIKNVVIRHVSSMNNPNMLTVTGERFGVPVPITLTKITSSSSTNGTVSGNTVTTPNVGCVTVVYFVVSGSYYTKLNFSNPAFQTNYIYNMNNVIAE